jgi:hypothetical protein
MLMDQIELFFTHKFENNSEKQVIYIEHTAGQTISK